MTHLQDFLNSPVSVSAPAIRKAQVGDLFGIEVECEGKHVGLFSEEILKDWAPHNDGSLRAYKGYNPCEWVFNGPATYKRSVERVNNLFDYFKKNGAQLHLSNRTSVHVHFNMSDKTTYQLVNTYILFTILEDILDAYCGEDRNGNLFCLSSRHAEGQLRWFEDSVFNRFVLRYNENWRYCSLNLASLNKFGTVEFRGMRGVDNREELLDWLSIINDLVNYSCYTMKNPVELLERISVKSPMGFLHDVFSNENVNRLTKNLNDNAVYHSIYEGLRLVQMMVYKIGTEFDQVKLRGRDFWAGFQDDVEPEPDIAPADILNGRAGIEQAGLPRGRRGARIQPFPRVEMRHARPEAPPMPFWAQPLAGNMDHANRVVDGEFQINPVNFDEEF